MTKRSITAGRKLGNGGNNNSDDNSNNNGGSSNNNGSGNSGKQQLNNKGEKPQTKTETDGGGRLSFSTAQKMISDLLTFDRLEKESLSNIDKTEFKRKKYSKEGLSKKLGITPEELEKLELPYFYDNMVNKIALPLISLYCLAKFVKEGYKLEK